MSKKRTPAESNDDELTKEPPDVLQQDAKRAKLAPSSDTMLQDLPLELLADILVKAVVLEVKDMRLAKHVWGEKANVVIGRLGTVCLQWNSILETIFLRNKVHEILDGIANETFRLETLHQTPVELFVDSVATMKEEIFLLCRPGKQEPYINVHDRNNMAEVKDVIPLPGIFPESIAACNLSNCLYVLNFNRDSRYYSVLRITKDEEQLFRTSPFIGDLSLPYCHLSVAINGRLMILSRQERPNPSVVNIYNANGCLQSATTLFPDSYHFSYIYSVIQKSNGNLVLSLRPSDNSFDPFLKEIDTTGRIIRQYRSIMSAEGGINFADAFGRIWIYGLFDNVKLIDSEFNPLDLTVPERGLDDFYLADGTHYNNERNEIACIYKSLESDDPADIETSVLTIFRFTGE